MKIRKNQGKPGKHCGKNEKILKIRKFKKNRGNLEKSKKLKKTRENVKKSLKTGRKNTIRKIVEN
jgi:hypothetical protein